MVRHQSILPVVGDHETFTSRSRKTSTSIASFSPFFFHFSTEELQKEYRVFCQSDCNIPLLMILFLMCGAMYVTRGCFTNFWLLNYTLILAFFFGMVTSLLGGLAVSLRLAVWEPVASYPFESTLLKRVRTFLQSFHESAFNWTLLNDTLIVVFPTCCSLNVLGRSLLPSCLPNVSAWDSQYCNPSGPNGIPMDIFMFTIICFFILQVFFNGSRWETTFCSWCLQVALVNVSLYSAGSNLYPWLNLCFLASMGTSYEIERHSRILFLNQRDALRLMEENTKLQLEIATKDLASKRAMVRHVSHEIRTPLNITSVGMDTISRLIKKMPPSTITALLQETVSSCRLACSDALMIVTELLDFEKLAMGKFTLEKEPMRLVPWVEESVQIFRVTADSAGLTIDYDHPEVGTPEEVLLAAEVDPLKLATVMKNLMSNAIKFSKRGGTIKVQVKYYSVDTADAAKRESVTSKKRPTLEAPVFDNKPKPKSSRAMTFESVIISVKDDGVGLTKGDIKLLFQEGVQINANKNQNGGGSGFGLYVTKGIVELHNGRLWAESDGEGLGTTFFVQLPASVVPTPHDAHPHLPMPLGSGSGGSYSKDSLPLTAVTDSRTVADELVLAAAAAVSDNNMNISPPLHVLIVDDSALNRRILRSSLQLDGRYTCEEAVDGLEAVSRIMTDVHNIEAGLHVSFDVVLMDNQMPRMNGIQATEELRRCGYQGVIIGITGEGDHETKRQFTSAGAHDCLTKPVSHDTLVAAIVTHLSSKQQQPTTDHHLTIQVS